METRGKAVTAAGEPVAKKARISSTLELERIAVTDRARMSAEIGVNKENLDGQYTLQNAFEAVLERHRRNGERLFFFVDEWQTAGLQAQDVMWGFGSNGLTTEYLREVPSLRGTYRYPLWPLQVMVKITTVAPFVWRRATLKNIAYTLREATLVRDLLTFEFNALINAPLIMQQEEMELETRHAVTASTSRAAITNSVQSSAGTRAIEVSSAALPPAIEFSSVPVVPIAADINPPKPDNPTGVASIGSPPSGKTASDIKAQESPSPSGEITAVKITNPGGKTRFTYPYQKMSEGSRQLVPGLNVFISIAKLQTFHTKYRNDPEPYVKAVITELLGLDSEATRTYIGSLRTGSKGITNTVTSEFLPAIKAYFNVKKFPTLKQNRTAFLATQMVNKWRND
ncbi:hypothetical protein BV898_05554 [Hypsibius exemplaris]|uniref:Uncharacterized protein n=1 Tax=Hypsibius exemplaris TaxID=2072580 RepID=A0A1W0WZ80_HYPEX|nr:hypothetical protein BV898_05554 [Hypsibius exemplaris]